MARAQTVHIYEVDYATGTLVDGEGRRYHEQHDGTWLVEGAVHEGSVRYWGSGSHAGHINLCPMWVRERGAWRNIVTGKEKAER